MNKKFIFLLLSFLICIILLTGCGNKKNTAANQQAYSNEQQITGTTQSATTTCNICHGSGNLGACGCENGYRRISGRKVICSYCHGSGVRVCWKCRGKGAISVPKNNHSSGQMPNRNSKLPYRGGAYDNNTGRNAAVKNNCPICHGSGRKTCSSCHGSGYLSRTRYAPSYGFGGDTSYQSNVRCRACNGSGQMQCISCGGTGHLR